MVPVSPTERMLGAGTLAGVFGVHLPGLSALPPEARSAVWGAIGAGLAALVPHAAKALGRIVDALGRRAARAIDPTTAETVTAPEGAEGAAPAGAAEGI